MSKLEHDSFIPFHVPSIGEEEIQEVVDTLRTGWLTTGPKTRRFEENFAQFIGGGVQAMAVNSATSGLHLALEAIGIGPGDEVITSPYTFTATAEVVRYLGADPVLVDIDEASLNIDPAGIEAAITPRTKAIVPVHIGGLSCQMDAILRISRRYGLRVVDDAAHALPATFDSHIIGSLGTDATVFSFYATKTLATGEGGMIVTRNTEIARRCRLMRLHGIDRDAFDRYTSTKPAWYYRVIAPGFKYNMTDVAAAIGLHQLAKIELFRRKRESLAARYDQAFRNLELTLPAHAPQGDKHAWHIYTIRLKGARADERDQFIEELASARIGTSVHFIPLHLHPYWRDRYKLSPEQFPVATRAYQSIISLPLFPGLSDAEQDRIIDSVRSILTRL